MDKHTSESSDSVTAYSSTPKTPTSVSPPSPSPPQSSNTPQNHLFSSNFTKLYHSIFPPKSPVKDSSPLSPSPCSSTSSLDDHPDTTNNYSNGTTTIIENRLRQASFVLEYQQLCERYDLCCTHLQDLTDELESLRLDNATLRAANKKLTKLLSLSSQSAMQTCLRRLSLLDSNSIGSDLTTDEISGYSPTSVMDQGRFERNNPERLGLPKSISVRSSSYLKSNRPSTPNNSSSGPPAGNQSLSQMPSAQDAEKLQKQTMYLSGAKKEAFDVCNQGMFKTELCNKWQETGACPYGNQCQFAHGIAELRPVIRHPRYKTEVCRMVVAGDSCPYGHRCHFRHTLTKQEMMLSPR